MTHAENIEKKIEQLNIKSTSVLREKVLSDASQAMEQTIDAAAPGPSIGRLIMKSNITKVAAAVIIIAAVTVIYQLTGSIDGAGVAWADVAETVSQIRTFKYHSTQIRKDERANFESITYVSGSNRRIDVYQSGKITMTHYVLPAEQELIVILSDGKILERIQLNKEDMDELNRKADIREMVQRFMSYSHKKLGRKTINGILTEGIEVDDTTLGDGDPLKASLCKLWVDIETNLPVLFESDVVFENGTQQTTIVDKFEWNIELDDSDFVPNIPDDYTDLNEKEKSKNSEHKTISKKELTEEDKETKAIIKEMAHSIFQACVNEDWERLFEFFHYELTESKVKYYEFLGGLKIVSIDDPFQHEGSSKWIIPYKVKLKGGKIREENLYIGYFEKKKRYIVTGGLKE